MNGHATHFSSLVRFLHWLMAVLIVSMLFIGLNQHLLWLHEPLGLLILALVLIRIHVRLNEDAPPPPQDMPILQRRAARLCHLLLYALMVVMPLVGWSMISAEGSPIVLMGWMHLPLILPYDIHLYRILRQTHMVLAILLAGILIMHFSAALYHGLIRRDGVFSSMASGGPQPRRD
jgi:cytochrome b561